jgi:hypothetical protein
MYPREMRTHVHTKACTKMFIIALFIIDQKKKTPKQPKCPSTGKWIDQVWPSQIVNYCLRNKSEQATVICYKKNELQSHQVNWKKPDIYMNYSEKANLLRWKACWWLFDARSGRDWFQMDLKWWKCSKTGLWWLCKLLTFYKNHWRINLKWVNFSM